MVDVGVVTGLAFRRRIERRDFFKLSDFAEVDRDGGFGIVIRVFSGRSRSYFAIFDYSGGPENDLKSYRFDGATSRNNDRRSSNQVEVNRAVVDNYLLSRHGTDLNKILEMYLTRAK